MGAGSEDGPADERGKDVLGKVAACESAFDKLERTARYSRLLVTPTSTIALKDTYSGTVVANHYLTTLIVHPVCSWSLAYLDENL